jgi:hypothetical protein
MKQNISNSARAVSDSALNFYTGTEILAARSSALTVPSTSSRPGVRSRTADFGLPDGTAEAHTPLKSCVCLIQRSILCQFKIPNQCCMKWLCYPGLPVTSHHMLHAHIGDRNRLTEFNTQLVALRVLLLVHCNETIVAGERNDTYHGVLPSVCLWRRYLGSSQHHGGTGIHSEFTGSTAL